MHVRWHALLAQLIVATGFAMVPGVCGAVLTNETNCDRHRSRMAQHAVVEVSFAGFAVLNMCDVGWGWGVGAGGGGGVGLGETSKVTSNTLELT